MAASTADQILCRIANANGIQPAVLREQIEQVLQTISVDATKPHAFMLQDLFPNGKPTVDEFVVAMEAALYDARMPVLPGWEWDGTGYRKIRR